MKKTFKFSNILKGAVRAFVTFIIACSCLMSVFVINSYAAERPIVECKRNITIKNSGKLNVKCNQYDDISNIILNVRVDDPSLINVKWGDWKSDNSINLKITAKSTGVTNIRITNNYNSEEKIIKVTAKKTKKAKKSNKKQSNTSLLAGRWSPDPNAEEPFYVEFHYDGNIMTYYRYQMVKGNGSGLNLNNQVTKFEYDDGYVNLFWERGYGWCENRHSARNVVTFYFDKLAKGIITTDEGIEYYKVD